MEALGLQPDVVFNSDHHRVVEGIVAAGIAVALIPRLAQPVTREDVVVKPIAPQPPVRRVGIAVRDGDHRPAAVTTMIELLEQTASARTKRESGTPKRLRAAS
jgi:DNA-binding transcriptional LysR family regulator